jgi:two-component system response regulator DesR
MSWADRVEWPSPGSQSSRSLVAPAPEADESRRPPLERENQAEPIRVLIADDDHRVRGALSALLTASPGVTVVGAAASAQGALELAREGAPSVALIDLLLPELDDGLSLIDAVSGELRIPVIAISIDGGLQDRALAAGAVAFVDKDSAPELLLDAVQAGSAA